MKKLFIVCMFSLIMSNVSAENWVGVRFDKIFDFQKIRCKNTQTNKEVYSSYNKKSPVVYVGQPNFDDTKFKKEIDLLVKGKHLSKQLAHLHLI